jgi:uncharacterized UPF0146 family protein
MALTAKHTVEEINGIPCTVVEKGITAKRSAFLKDLLELNKLEVVVAEVPAKEEGAPSSYTLGVTDIVFNPTIAVYEMALKTRDGKSVSPDYWEQKTSEIKDEYWEK